MAALATVANHCFSCRWPHIAFARFYTSNRGCRPSSSGTVPMEANNSANLLVIEGVNALYMPGLLSYEKETKQNSEWCKFGRTSVKAPITADTALLELLQRQNFLLFLLNASLLYMLHKGREIIATLWWSDLIISACHFHLVANHNCYFMYNTGGHFQLGGKRYSRICRPSFHLVMSQVVSNTLFGEWKSKVTHFRWRSASHTSLSCVNLRSITDSIKHSTGSYKT